MYRKTQVSDLINIAKMAPQPMDMTSLSALPQAFASGLTQGRQYAQAKMKEQAFAAEQMRKNQEFLKNLIYSDNPYMRQSRVVKQTSAPQRTLPKQSERENVSAPLLNELPMNNINDLYSYPFVNETGNALFSQPSYSMPNEQNVFSDDSNEANNMPENMGDSVHFMQTVLSPNTTLSADQEKALLLQNSGFRSI